MSTGKRNESLAHDVYALSHGREINYFIMIKQQDFHNITG